jgi:hypothetical protein
VDEKQTAGEGQQEVGLGECPLHIRAKEESGTPCAALRQIAWQGTSLTDPPPARQLLVETRASRERLTPEQIARYGRFYNGQEQWDQAVEARRKSAVRPTLTVNLLPGLVARMAHDSAAKGQPLSEQERADLVIAVTMLNMDAQKLYNYLASAAAECCSVCLHRQKAEAANA